jgi:hypothetical protein
LVKKHIWCNQEGYDNEVVFQEEPTMFDIFVTWIYRGPVAGPDGDDDSKRVSNLARAWNFAHRMHLYAFKNVLMDRIRRSRQEALIELELLGFCDNSPPKDHWLEQYNFDPAVYNYVNSGGLYGITQKFELIARREDTSHGVLCRPCTDLEENREVLPAILPC